MIISASTGQAFFIGSTELRCMIKIITSKKIAELFKEDKESDMN